ncbi:MAG TPA: hypothetical protein VLH38_03915 [Patescibacteria group bacterium]|nr:hypothetical protein [Patescibacteria group bacterium]
MLSSFYTFAAAKCTEHGFFGLPTWYHYLVLANKMVADAAGRCVFVDYGTGAGKFALSDLSLIGLALIDILLRLSALIAVGYVMYGGFSFITAQGEPDKVKHAQGTIFNALIGLGISLAAIGGVAFAGKALGG